MNSSSNPLVSIGIPTYNRASGNLGRVIERALGQTYQNIEVIVSDNCSSDNTTELVQSFKDSRLRYFRQENNIGANKNFNYCLDQAKGEYFLLFHDDDLIDQDFVEVCISALEPGQSAGTIFTGVRIIDEDGKVLEEHKNRAAGLSPEEFIKGWYKGQIALYLCNTLYNTARLKEIGGFSSKKNLFDDLVPTFTLAIKYGRVDILEEKASFRRHSGNAGSSVPIHDWIDDSLYLLDHIYSLFPSECHDLSDDGRLYFCKKLYRYTAVRQGRLNRLMDYIRIYRAYGFCYSPVRHLYLGRVSRKLAKIKQALARN
jgi:glycosyltransferase involved in cell wall biosynthesis